MSIHSLKSQFTPIQSTQSSSAQDKETERLRKACADFEAIFISQMFKVMHESSEESSIFGDGLGADLYQGLFDEKVSEKLAESGSLGIGKVLYQKLAARLANDDSGETSPISIRKAVLNQSTEKLKEKATQVESQTISIPKISSGSGNKLSPSMVNRIQTYEDEIQEAAIKYQLPLNLVYGVIAQESAGDAQSVSKVGAKGLMQLMDETASDMGVDNSYNPRQNIMGGARYLREQLDRFDGDLKLALAAYNAGPGNVEKYQGIPPFKETHDYVSKVLSYAGQFSDILGTDKTETL
jgi:Rod binding domain-containing protein